MDTQKTITVDAFLKLIKPKKVEVYIYCQYNTGATDFVWIGIDKKHFASIVISVLKGVKSVTYTCSDSNPDRLYLDLIEVEKILQRAEVSA
jgi:hypothetical protein